MLIILAEATQRVVTGVDILEQVSSFFYVAWGMLLGMVVLIAAVVGWLVPWWISRAQKRSFELKEKDLLHRIETQREEAERRIRDLEERLTQKMDEELADTQGDAFFTQGVVLLQMKGMRGTGVQLALHAARNYVKARDEQKEKAGISLQGAIEACQGHEDELRNRSETNLGLLNKLAAEIEDKGLQARFGGMVEQLRKLLEKPQKDTQGGGG